MARDPRMPATFDLPDGDFVALITWAYVVDKFEKILNGVITNMDLINKDLGRIDKKIDQWTNKEE